MCAGGECAGDECAGCVCTGGECAGGECAGGECAGSNRVQRMELWKINDNHCILPMQLTSVNTRPIIKALIKVMVNV